MILSLQTVQPIEKVYTTGQRPVLVSTSDLKKYVCKYVHSEPANYLVAEMVTNLVASEIGLRVPRMSFISIKNEHWDSVEYSDLMPRTKYEKCGLGFEYLPLLDLTGNEFPFLIDKKKKKLSNYSELLSISLFDHWIANDDRNHNNLNLLIDVESIPYQIVPIDHGAAFNTMSGMHHQLVEQTFDESLLRTALFESIFRHKRNTIALHKKVLDELDNWVDVVRLKIPEWMNLIPEEWSVAKDTWASFLNERWLSAEWTLKVKRSFSENVQKMIQ